MLEKFRLIIALLIVVSLAFVWGYLIISMFNNVYGLILSAVGGFIIGHFGAKALIWIEVHFV